MVAQVKVQPLNQRTIKSGLLAARQYVQDEKIIIARTAITRGQYAEKWPEEYLSYVTSERKNNQYKDPEKFFRVMHSKPQWYARKFIFRPLIDSSDQIRKAAIEANQIAHQQANKYGVVSGHYGASFVLMRNNSPISSITQLDDLGNTDSVSIANTAAYAKPVERNALYHAKIGGVLFYAAQQIKKRYPQLGVRFVYRPANQVPGTYSKYGVPVLTIGTREAVIDKITRPGRKDRATTRRDAAIRRQKRLAAKAQLRR